MFSESAHSACDRVVYLNFQCPLNRACADKNARLLESLHQGLQIKIKWGVTTASVGMLHAHIEIMNMPEDSTFSDQDALLRFLNACA